MDHDDHSNSFSSFRLQQVSRSFFSGSCRNFTDVFVCYVLTYVCSLHRNMGGVDMSDALIGYYSVLRKTRKWYRSLFFHFVDIAVVNAFIIHQHLAAMQSKKPKNQREFREALIQELADWLPPPDVPAAPAPQHSAGHTPKHLKPSSKFRRRCRVCHQKTPVICCMCDMPLCFLPKRDCFNRWHNDHL